RPGGARRARGPDQRRADPSHRARGDVGPDRIVPRHVGRALRVGVPASARGMIAKLRLQVEGIGWLIAWRIARWLPEAWIYRTFERLSARSLRRNTKRRAAVEELLRPVVAPQELNAAV